MGIEINYDKLLDMKVELTSELGSTELTLFDILQLKKGSIIDLKKPAGENCEFFVNKRMLGKAEILVYEKNLAIRINEVLDSSSMEYYLRREDGK